MMSGSKARKITLSGGEGVVMSGADVRYAQFGADSTLRVYGGRVSTTLLEFGAGDGLDLASFGYSKAETFTFSYAPAVTRAKVTVTDGAMTASIILFGQFTAAGFHIAADHAGGSVLTYSPPSSASTPAIATGHH